MFGNLIALFTMMKGLPLSYNRDMQDDKTSLFAAYDTALSCVTVFTRMIGTAKWNKDRMARSCTGGYANATDVADYLVKKGMPFRTAHEVASGAVRLCIDKKCNLEDLSIEEFKSFSSLIESDIFSLITPESCMRARTTAGGPSPLRVQEQIVELHDYYVHQMKKL